MKVVMYMAMTANGIIARENGREDFLSDLNWKVFCNLARKKGCFVVGRKTYEIVRKLYKNYNFDDVKAERIIITSKKNFQPKGYLIANSPKNAIKKASSAGFKELLLSGGGKLNNSFIKSSLVDEIILNVEPVLLGKGVKLFGEDNFEKTLSLIRVKKLSKGIVQLHYKVRKGR